MTEVQITVQLPDQVESMEQLEAVIDAKGQQIKQQLFEHQLASLIQQQKAAESSRKQQKAAESSRKQQPRISHVQNAKKEPSSKVINSVNQRLNRSCFLCPAATEVPIRWPIIPAEQRLPGRHEGFS